MVNIGLSTPDHPNRGLQLWLVGVVMVLVAAIFVIVRLAARYVRSGIQMDDWTIFASLTISAMFTLSHNIAIHYGYGQHSMDLERDRRISALKALFVCQVLYKVVICLTKVSILLLYVRVFSIAKNFTRCCIAMIVFTIISGIAFLGPTIWQCRPIASYWDRSIKHVCISNHATWLSYALINIITDFMILLLPVQQVLRLQLKLRDKISIIMIFMLGGFVCITSIIRTTSLAASSNLQDVTWHTIGVSVWSTIELNTGIICACLPMIRQPLSFIFPNLFSASDRSNSHPYEHSYMTASRHKSRCDRSVPTANRNLTWTRDHADHVFIASVKPGARDGYMHRTESEENMIDLERMDANGNGIIKTTDVSISAFTRSDYGSSPSHRTK
ncbi:conserved hypothetical protein [Coccidioides posadasii str. Silveira]|uniref:Rhodopsin domain-containing protein n=3 Tax=Coccidioides posadasii TaxID=199306 RepID=E9CWZ4_COCPS|nr:conserved hypothetical protein [Coccidioides posadasii str. Silveira]KMM65278.1 hypothetical protein CPAG_01629 [Coccidioides posadasii RMSCC 3488]